MEGMTNYGTTEDRKQRKNLDANPGAAETKG
jgi:hypothetical protein